MNIKMNNIYKNTLLKITAQIKGYYVTPFRINEKRGSTGLK